MILAYFILRLLSAFVVGQVIIYSSSRDVAEIDRGITDMRWPNPNKFILNEEDDVAGQLGILIDKGKLKAQGVIELRRQV